MIIIFIQFNPLYNIFFYFKTKNKFYNDDNSKNESNPPNNIDLLTQTASIGEFPLKILVQQMNRIHLRKIPI